MEFLTGCFINAVIFAVVMGAATLLTPYFNEPWFLVVAGLLQVAFMAWPGRDLRQTLRALHPEGSQEQRRAGCLFAVLASLIAVIVLLLLWALTIGPPPNQPSQEL
jgi:heme O synthase-like polyprenyltransferase